LDTKIQAEQFQALELRPRDALLDSCSPLP
jgi:hypothetical protein